MSTEICTEKMSVTNQLLNEIKDSQAAIQETISLLAKRIEPVMKDKSESAPKDSKKKATDCLLAGELLSIANIQKVIYNDLYEIAGRIAL
jgi:hypothetical protein